MHQFFLTFLSICVLLRIVRIWINARGVKAHTHFENPYGGPFFLTRTGIVSPRAQVSRDAMVVSIADALSLSMGLLLVWLNLPLWTVLISLLGGFAIAENIRSHRHRQLVGKMLALHEILLDENRLDEAAVLRRVCQDNSLLSPRLMVHSPAARAMN